ncbi:hypothetical protein MVEN_01065100 [Mycena venus]|uniref:Uncharacterized protein n=1 Tax=Mycena venus TaxID=2733690 RepID=A0A8H6Y8G2_9AGAR|nr:hypothetical protein MVEN_01065100 [Mycena venus]
MAAAQNAALQAVHQERVNNILNRHRELAERITLALDAEVIADSDIDEKALVQSLQNELETLKERTERHEMQDHLRRNGVVNDVRDGLFVMTVQLESRRAELDPSYTPPLRQPAERPSQAAGPSRLDDARVASDAPRLGTSLSGGLEPASGPRRGIQSIRDARDRANATPPSTSLRPRLPIPSDGQTFDVVFLPFRSDHAMQLPDQALCASQLCLRDLGLVFQVRLPRQDSAKRHFDCQVKSFCEDKNIDLQSGQLAESPVWTLMAVKKRSNKCDLHSEFLAPSELTTERLGKAPFDKLRNYLSEDGVNRVLLIAPVYADLKGGINLPNVEKPQMKHYCHVPRVEAAIANRKGKCTNKCPTELDTGSSSRYGTGRTLAH